MTALPTPPETLLVTFKTEHDRPDISKASSVVSGIESCMLTTTVASTCCLLGGILSITIVFPEGLIKLGGTSVPPEVGTTSLLKPLEGANWC